MNAFAIDTMSNFLDSVRINIPIALIAFFCMFCGCSPSHTNERLSMIDDMSDNLPDEALDSLYSINDYQLSDIDKHYFDFLLVKVNDKAYIRHTSDSLILSVIDYESKHLDYGRYPEALYYGGRVYSDIGDYPTALYYFRKSLDELQKMDEEDMELKRRVVSQTGRLLTDLRLYDEARPYIESGLEMNRNRKDTLSMVYDLQLLGGMYLRSGKYGMAEKYFDEAIKLGGDLDQSHNSKSRMYLAAIKLKQNQLDSALKLITGTKESVDPLVRNNALAYGAEIFLEKDILDSAYLYASELINSSNLKNKDIGYHVLLSPKLRPFINGDSLTKYIDDYRSLLEKFWNENEIQLSINQQNAFNYQIHERERFKAVKSNESLQHWIVGFIFVIIVLGMIVLSLRNRTQAYIIKLQEALDNIRILRSALEKVTQSSKNNDSDDTSIKVCESYDQSSKVGEKLKHRGKEYELREKLKSELMSLYHSAEGRDEISPIILKSEVYGKLQNLIMERKIIPGQSPLWIEIEDTVSCCSPDFRVNLNLLTSGKLSDNDWHTALLIKCGIKPSQMTILLGKSNGAIVSRRESLCLKVLDEKLGVKVIDSIIRLL